MVANITSLTGNGLKDWLVQRVSAVFLLFYFIYLAVFFFQHPQPTFTEWSTFFHSFVMQVATILAVLSLSLHSWVGLWTVTTDYINCTVLRLSVQLLILVWILAQFLACLMIIWGQ